jgi:hypothetical protein
MKSFLAILSFTLFANVSLGGVKGVVVLVPGTGNSLLPGAVQKSPISKELSANPYFSKSILEVIQKRNFEVLVIKGLAPAGLFQSNGKKSLEVLSSWYLKKYPQKNVPITLIGHSAGGFYSLHMAHLNKTLPIRDVVLLSSGLKGLRIAEIVFPGDAKTPAVTIPGLGFFIDVRGLPQFKPDHVKKFIAQLRLPETLRLFAVGGSQQPSSRVTEIAQPQFLSPILKVSASLIGEECDGIVESQSAYAQGVRIATREGGFVEPTSIPNLHMNLEHPEQVFDHRIFAVLGTWNVGYIRDAQVQLYNGLLDILER